MTTGRFTLPVVIFITLICWAIVFFFISDFPESRNSYSFLRILSTNALPLWANQIISFSLHIVIGYFLIALNNTFGLIRVRASVQTTVYLLLVTASPFIHTLSSGDVAAISLLLAIYYLFGSYQSTTPSKLLFQSALFIGIGSLAFPQLTFFMLPLWIGAFNMKSLTFRSFWASIIGWAFPFWFFFGYAFCTDRMELFYQPFVEMATFHPIDIDLFHPWEIVTLLFCAILFICSGIHTLVSSFADKIRTRIYLRFLILLTLFIFLLCILQPIHGVNLISPLLIGISILVGHTFALTHSKASNLFFVFVHIGLIALFCFNVWMLL